MHILYAAWLHIKFYFSSYFSDDINIAGTLYVIFLVLGVDSLARDTTTYKV